MKRLLILLLSLCMIVSFAVMPVGAADYVNNIVVGITPPAEGFKPTNAALSSTASTKLLDTKWEGEFAADGSFQGGKKYTVTVTVGMKEMYQAKKVRMCMPRDWNAGALRKVLHGPVTCHIPCSLFQNHPDAKLYASRLACETQVVPEIRIYNK